MRSFCPLRSLNPAWRSAARQLLAPVLLALAVSSPGCDRGESPEPTLAKARELASDGYYSEAAQLLKSKLEVVRAADRPQLHGEIARLYHRANVFDLALASAERALQGGNTSPEVLLAEADSLRALTRPGAEEKLRALLARAPDLPGANLGLARFLLRSADPAAALPLFEAYFKAATAEDLDYKTALAEHARALRNVGRYQEAADRYMLLLEDDPLEGIYYGGLAEALYRLKLRPEGKRVEEIYKAITQNAFEEHVEDRLREAGNTAFAQGQRAINRTRQKRYLEAFRSYYAAMKADPEEGRLRIFFADLAVQFRRFAEARAILSDGLQRKLQPASGFWWLLGRAALEAEAYPEALQAFQGALQALRSEGDLGGLERGQAPAFSVALALASCAVELKNAAGARQAAEAARTLQPASWEPSYWLGRADLVEGKAAEAVARFNEAVQKGCSIADLRVYGASALALLGKAGEAQARLKALLEAQPTHRGALAELVRLARDSGAPDPAVEEQLARVESERATIRKLDAQLDQVKLQEAGPTYLALARAYLALKDPRGFDLCFLASDLLPRDVDAIRLLLGGMRGPFDLFLRIRLLRRLVDLEPKDAPARLELAREYLALHVRLDEVDRLALQALGAGVTDRASGVEGARLRAGAARARGEAARAAAIAREALQVYPGAKELQTFAEQAISGPGRP